MRFVTSTDKITSGSVVGGVQQDRHVIAVTIGHGQVEFAVAIEIRGEADGLGKRPARQRGQKRVDRTEIEARGRKAGDADFRDADPAGDRRLVEFVGHLAGEANETVLEGIKLFFHN